MGHCVAVRSVPSAGTSLIVFFFLTFQSPLPRKLYTLRIRLLIDELKCQIQAQFGHLVIIGVGTGDQGYRALSTEPVSFLLPGWRGQFQSFTHPILLGAPVFGLQNSLH